MEQFKPKKFTPFSTVNKTTMIKKAVEEKDRKIKSYTENKSESIARSSSFNGAWEMIVALVSTGQCPRENIWIEHEQLMKEYYMRFSDYQREGQEQKAEQTQEKTIQLDY